ncbi:MAG: hypothetical protein JNK72_15740 [Myxococcales bacterium]|nr:hypothetical protein [Myxococcales bacterium]
MSQGRRSLPLFEGMLRADPSTRWKIEQARQRLGGRVRGNERTGAIVTVMTPDGLGETGVVLYEGEGEVDVWRLGDRVRRTSPTNVLDRHDATVDPKILAVSADARVFATLEEGMTVRFLHPSGQGERATLFEKCRYGALVARDDGSVLAVGFRRLMPLAAEA